MITFRAEGSSPDEIVPASPPPPGLTSNWVDPESIASGLIVPNVVFMVLAIVAVALRMYTRVCLIHNVGSDDCKFVLCSLPPSDGGCGWCVLCVVLWFADVWCGN